MHVTPKPVLFQDEVLDTIIIVLEAALANHVRVYSAFHPMTAGIGSSTALHPPTTLREKRLGKWMDGWRFFWRLQM
ncbi:hypothetical protein AOLI_G00135400 [Acnodon oligacanthus]